MSVLPCWPSPSHTFDSVSLRNNKYTNVPVTKHKEGNETEEERIFDKYEEDHTHKNYTKGKKNTLKWGQDTKKDVTCLKRCFSTGFSRAFHRMKQPMITAVVLLAGTSEQHRRCWCRWSLPQFGLHAPTKTRGQAGWSAGGGPPLGCSSFPFKRLNRIKAQHFSLEQAAQQGLKSVWSRQWLCEDVLQHSDDSS